MKLEIFKILLFIFVVLFSINTHFLFKKDKNFILYLISEITLISINISLIILIIGGN
jgi:NADH:ubiquinone oxidoreductase subunit K